MLASMAHQLALNFHAPSLGSSARTIQQSWIERLECAKSAWTLDLKNGGRTTGVYKRRGAVANLFQQIRL